MRHSKTKLFSYWCARFTPESYGNTMQQLLKAAFDKTTVQDRLLPVSAEENYFHFINYKTVRNGYFCSEFFGYFLGTGLPRGTTAELIQSLGNISAIAGSLLGWSVGWLSQSRSLIKEIDYHSARQLFRQLGDIQRELIWRWGIVFSCSVIVIIGSVVMKMTSLSEDGFHWTMTAAVGFLGVALGFIAYLFERMLALSALKSKLDDFEHDELHKQRLLGDASSDE